MSQEEHKKHSLISDTDTKRDIRKKETSIIKKIMKYFIIALLVIVLVGGFFTWNYIKGETQPVDTAQTELVSFEIEQGASVKEVSKALEKEGIIRNSKLFNFYLKFKNVSGFKSGLYHVSKSMTLDEIIAELSGQGKDKDQNATKVLIREGEQLTEIAKEVEKSTKYSAEDFMAKVQDEDFLRYLVQKFPKLLTQSYNGYQVKYVLEGYLFPATYDMNDSKTLQMLITEMVAKTDEVMSKYYDKILASDYTLQETMALASLIEKEGSKLEDRKKISSVFHNRIKENMKLQTDVSVQYALGEHKEALSLEDLEVDSPYNLYQNYGVGPGPYNSPSEDAIVAAMEPEKTDYLYFLADIHTKEIYYAKTYEEHLELKAKYIDNKE
ncbi:endolytic transglycosylase MltG [Streptococcus sp. 263_SSPC]|uniref:endolytic transglycosylase MltG n=1 Tax=Streptococcus sp. 263_SSPC TaxID=1579343 RepID=UPI0006608008|nr:endolytic transglycosylase MltG [Streptococcus sp. 263_SSPC]